MRALDRGVFRRCTAVVALGPSHAASLTQVDVHPTHVLPLPIGDIAYDDVYLHNDARARPATTVGFVGELSMLKGVPRLSYPSLGT